MNRVFRFWGLFLALGLLAVSGTGCKSPSGKPAVIQLLRQDRSAFYSYLSDFGVDNDPDKVFRLSGGVLHVSGQHLGYLATKQEYENYRLVAEFKWGDQTWPPRLDKARDSGILVHATGADAVWPTCIEAQLIEGGTGDILVVNGAYLTVAGETKGPAIARFDRPGRNPWEDKLGFRGPNEIEQPHGEWNRMEIVCEGGNVSVTVNGQQTIAGTNATPRKGKILLQSEGAEIFFQRLDLYPIR
jgi:Domain of Unknown Function (DUF1080)